MAKLVYALNVSLDGYVDHDRVGPPDQTLFRYFVDDMASLSGLIHGRTMYELMAYWDEDQVGENGEPWGADERAFAAAWRKQPKWVVSSTLKTVGPNATLLTGDLETAVRRIKAETDGVIEVAGTKLAESLGEMGLIDEYHLYVHPMAVGSGTPMFRGPVKGLRLLGVERIGESVVRLAYGVGSA